MHVLHPHSIGLRCSRIANRCTSARARQKSSAAKEKLGNALELNQFACGATGRRSSFLHDSPTINEETCTHQGLETGSCRVVRAANRMQRQKVKLSELIRRALSNNSKHGFSVLSLQPATARNAYMRKEDDLSGDVER